MGTKCMNGKRDTKETMETEGKKETMTMKGQIEQWGRMGQRGKGEGNRVTKKSIGSKGRGK